MSAKKPGTESEHEPPNLTVDMILRKKPDFILLEKRRNEPFQNELAFPGGFVEYGERVEDAVLRELKEECSVDANLVAILGVYSNPRRDPRGHTISVVFVGDWKNGTPLAADDARSVEWYKIGLLRSSQNMAFDHSKILKDYVQWSKSKTRQLTFWSSKK